MAKKSIWKKISEVFFSDDSEELSKEEKKELENLNKKTKTPVAPRVEGVEKPIDMSKIMPEQVKSMEDEGR